MKNLTFRWLVVILTSIISAVLLVIALLYSAMATLMPVWIAYLLVAVLVVLSIYFVINRFLGIFIYRRIKLIYKLIRSSKVSLKQGELPGQSVKAIEQVEEEVTGWLESQQEEIRSLKELESYRKDFLGNISHELKTPIFAVQGYIHTLLDGGMEDVMVHKRFLEKAAKNIERLQTIVEDLDVIARLEDATMQLDYVNFDLKDLFAEVIEHVEVQAHERNISVDFKDGADRNFMVFADREYIRTVLTNLVINSIKYGKPGGRTRIGSYDMVDYILIEVSDDGIGIASQHIRHLFDRFYRVDKSRSRSKGGSGLGLSIVKHIIEAHKQTLNVRSTEGEGTTVGFTLAKQTQTTES